MKINQEKFNQLSQLDRIEFRQKYDRIENFFNGSVLVSFSYMFAFALAFILLMYVGLLNISAEVAKQFLLNMLPLVSIVKIVFIVAFIFDIIIVVIKVVNKDKLQKEYFKETVKPKLKK